MSAEAVLWVEKMGYRSNHPRYYILKRFAEKYLYGDEIPTRSEINNARIICPVSFSIIYDIDDPRVKPEYLFVVRFNLDSYDLCTTAISFAVCKDDRVIKKEHQRDSCPFLEPLMFKTKKYCVII
jgi:hypothetical protein